MLLNGIATADKRLMGRNSEARMPVAVSLVTSRLPPFSIAQVKAEGHHPV
jgi:hypothetical protein